MFEKAVGELRTRHVEPSPSSHHLAPAPEPDLDWLAREANAEHRAYEATQSAAVAHAIACGAVLIEAKAKIGHGGWLAWIRESLEFSEDTAGVYMRLARNSERARNMPSIRAALAEMADPKRAKPDAPELSHGEALTRRLQGVREDLAKGPLGGKSISEDEAWTISTTAADIVEMIGPLEWPPPPLAGVWTTRRDPGQVHSLAAEKASGKALPEGSSDIRSGRPEMNLPMRRL